MVQCNIKGESSIGQTKTAEPTALFGMVSRVGPKNRVLDGVAMPLVSKLFWAILIYKLGIHYLQFKQG